MGRLRAVWVLVEESCLHLSAVSHLDRKVHVVQGMPSGLLL